MADHNKQKVDAVTGMTTTGHSWDGIEELNYPLPRWWLYVFYATIIWSIGYWLVYPSWPLVQQYTVGAFNWHSRSAVEENLEALRTMRGPMNAKLAAASLEDVRFGPDRELFNFAVAQGKAAFADNCAPCHGSGAQGAIGYPNLNDDDWLWGGNLGQIEKTIMFGARSTSDEGHTGEMTAFGRDGLLKPAEISQVADYVRSLSGLSVDPKSDLKAGATIFQENCAVCHGEDAKGNQELGAPNLTDQIWLYGSDKATIMAGIQGGRGSVMPTWQGRLDDTTIKALTVYVHQLGGGVR